MSDLIPHTGWIIAASIGAMLGYANLDAAFLLIGMSTFIDLAYAVGKAQSGAQHD